VSKSSVALLMILLAIAALCLAAFSLGLQLASMMR
jgi:hypothetical protein